jgi:hypothetical protein
VGCSESLLFKVSRRQCIHIVVVLWRLRTRQTVAIAPLSCKDDVGVGSVQGAYEAIGWFHADNITRAAVIDVAHGMQRGF